MIATGRTALDAYAYSDADLTPLPGAVVPAARVALAYGRLHRGAGARWAEVLFGVAGDGAAATRLDDGSDGGRESEERVMSESSKQSEWSVTMRNHLYHADDPSDEPAYFRRTFPGATAADAHAAAVAYGLDAGDCSPVEDVAEVEGPLSAPSCAEVAL